MRVSRGVLAGLTAATLALAVALTAWLTGAFAAGPTRAVSWSTVKSEPYATLEANGLAVGGKLYAFGGFDSTHTGYTATNRAYVYDPAANTWTAIAPLPPFNGVDFGVSHAGVATDGTNIYLAGGYSSNATHNGQIFGAKEVYAYRPATNDYARLPDLPDFRAAGGLAYLGGKLHYFGGTNRARDRETPEHWVLDLANPAAGWKTAAPIDHPRNHIGVVELDGKIYAAGGQTGQDALSTSQTTLDAYDPATDTWTTLPPVPAALSHTTAAVLDGKILVAGGQTSFNATVAGVYAYDPKTNEWTTYSRLPAPRYSGVLGVIDGTIFYAGGSTTPVTYKGVPGGTTPPPATTPTTPTTTSTTPTTTTPAPPPPGPPVTLRVDFQPAGLSTPARYTPDTGLPFAAARGFGWVRAGTHTPLDRTAAAQVRNATTDQRLNTFLRTGGATPAAWEAAVPNGTYAVTVRVGDGSASGLHTVRADGTAVVDAFRPTSTRRYAVGTATVTVADGLLTLDTAGTDAALGAVEIVPVG